MTPITEREFGNLEEKVSQDHENVSVLFEKVDKLADSLASYVKTHNSEHGIIDRQLGSIRYLWAIVLLAVGSSVTAVVTLIVKG